MEVEKDVEALFHLLFEQESKQAIMSGSVRQPESIRLILSDPVAFLAQSIQWQIGVLRRVAMALKTPYDVARFLCLNSLENTGSDALTPRSPNSAASDVDLDVEKKLDKERRVSFAARCHNRIFDAMVELFQECMKKREEQVADSVLLVLSCVISAGITVENLKRLFKMAAQGLIDRDSRTQLRILHLIESGIRRSESSIGGKNIDQTADLTTALALDPDNRSPFILERDEHQKVQTSLKSPAPRSFFNFGGGEDSGIRLSGLGKWPFPREYCVWYWARMEEGCGRCNILKMKTRDGYGINIALVGDDVIGFSLLMETKDERNSGSLRVNIPTERMASKTWHQVTIHHYTRMLGSSVIKVYVDGHEIKQPNGYGFVLTYPSRFGKDNQVLSMASVFEGFDGQTGPFYIFNEGITPPISDALISYEHRLFETDGEARQACPQSGLITSIVDKGLETKVYLGFDCRTVVNNLCLDLYGGHHGVMERNSFVWGLQNIKNLVGAIGGISSLLPFLWKKGGTGSGDSMIQSFPSSSESRSLSEGACIIAILNLLSRLLEGHVSNQREFRNIGGASLIASALERIPQRVLSSACSERLYLSLEEEEEEEDGEHVERHDDEDYLRSTMDAPMFSSLRGLFESVASWPELVHDITAVDRTNSPKSNPKEELVPNKRQTYNALEKAIDTHLIFNLKILARCTDPDGTSPLAFASGGSLTQIQWFEFLEYRLAMSPIFFRQVVRIQQWLDSLRMFYERYHRQSNQAGTIMGSAAAAAGGKGRQSFTSFFGYHAVRIGVKFLSEGITDDDLQALLCAAVGAGHGIEYQEPVVTPNTPSSPSSTISSSTTPSPPTTPTRQESFTSAAARGFIGGLGFASSVIGALSPSTNPESAPPNTPRGTDVVRWTNVDLYLARDAIRTLLILLRMETPPKNLYEACAKLNNGNGLASILVVNVVASQSVGEELRSLAIRCITEYLQNVHLHVTNFEQISKNVVNSSSSTGITNNWYKDGMVIPRGVQLFDDMGGYATMLHALLSIVSTKFRRPSSPSEFSGPRFGQHENDLNSAYSALLEMMIAQPKKRVPVAQHHKSGKRLNSKISRRRSVGSITTNVTSNTFLTMTSLSEMVELDVEDIFADQSKFGPVLDDTQIIHNPFAMTIIVKLIPRLDLYLQQRVCQDLFLLLKFQPENRQRFMEIPGWQGSFLGLLGSLDRAGLRSSGAQVCYDLGVKLLLLVLQDGLCERPGGWKEIESLISLHPLLVNGDHVVRSLVAQLLQELNRHLQSEDVSNTFPILWSSLRRTVILIEMMSTSSLGMRHHHLQDEERDEYLEKIVNTMMDIVDLVCSFPPRLLFSIISTDPDYTDREAVYANVDLLREFCWPVEVKYMTDLDKIRGPVAFSVISLSLFMIERTNPDSPQLQKHTKRLQRVMQFLRKMPRVKTMIRWATGGSNSSSGGGGSASNGPNANKNHGVGRIKGEKSALVAKTFLVCYEAVGKARESGKYEEDGVNHNLKYFLNLLQTLSKDHHELLNAIVPAGMLQKIDQLRVDQPKWVLDPCLAEDLLLGSSNGRDDTNGSGSSSSVWKRKGDFEGLRGALSSLTEANHGLKAFFESKMKSNWESYCANEMALSKTSLRAKMESMVMEYQQRLSYGELNRLSTFSTMLHERNCELVLSWRKLTVESAHDASIWIIDGDSSPQETHWMLSEREDSMRCRRLLCRNYFYDSHRDAVYHYSKDVAAKSYSFISNSSSNNSNTRLGTKSPSSRTLGDDDVTKLEQLSTQIKKTEEDDMLFSFRWLGGRLENEPDLTWFEYLGGKVNRGHKKVAGSSSPRKSSKRRSLRKRSSHALPKLELPDKIEAQEPVVVSVPEEEKPIRNETSAISSSASSPSSQQQQQQASTTKSLLNEIDEWAVSGWENARREQFALQKGEVLVHVCANAQWITPLQVTKGRVEISTSHIFFYAHRRSHSSNDSEYDDEVNDDDDGEEEDYIESLRLDTTESTKLDEGWTDMGDSSSSAFVTPTKGGGKSTSDDANKRSKRKKKTRRLTYINKDMMRWPLADLTEIHGRRYLLRSTALELFFKDMTNIFLCFPTAKARSDCFKAILKQQTPNLARTFKESLKPRVVFERSGLTEKWRKREISNFEYLMQLNTIAGRSYNDITQYPVFPWVISDYTSKTIDLNNPNVYRDLSKPIGALNEDRLQDFVERFETFNDPSMDIPAFHYGSHYSNAGIVLHYLLRMEPYTTLAIDLQGGRFDCPDRLFFSVQDCWLGSMESMSDVKELIPEFFYCPEMLQNRNKLNLGTRQDDGTVVDDVILPPWANGSAQEFIRINREALESEYVSENLHHWVDLIFGFKQLGKEAEHAHNVFYYLTYEGSVDLDSIVDPVQRHSIETQIAHFGQTPSQLLTSPHPKRLQCPTKQVLRGLINGANAVQLQFNTVWQEPVNKALVHNYGMGGSGIGASAPESGAIGAFGSLIKNVLQTQQNPVVSAEASDASVNVPALIWMHTIQDRMICVHEDLSYAVHRIANDNNLKLGQVRVLNSAPMSASIRARPRDRALIGSHVGQELRSGVETVSNAKQGKLLLTGNYFDNSLRAQSVENARIEDAVIAHRGRVLCIAVCETDDIVVTGSEDCTVGVWMLSGGGGQDVRDEVMEKFGAQAASSHSSATGVSSSSAGSTSSAAAFSGPVTTPAHELNSQHLLTFVRRLTSHSTPVTSVAVSSAMGVVVSGSASGHVYVHALHDGEFLRSLVPDSLHAPISSIQVGNITGNIVFHARSTRHLVVTSINGDLISRTVVEDSGATVIKVWYFNKYQTEILATGHENGMLCIRSTYDVQNVLGQISLSPINAANGALFPVPIRSLVLSPDGTAIFVGTDKGQIAVIKLNQIYDEGLVQGLIHL